MKYYFLVLCSSMVLFSCGQKASEHNEETHFDPPPAGTVIAADSVPVQDALNHFTFSVKVVSNEHSDHYGVYDVKAAYGPNTADGQFTMPKGGEELKPLLRKGKEENTYIIGFHYGTDTAFYEYYEVNGQHGQITMAYLKGYSFK
ncbi:hypothetical protein ACTHGU_17665 [Chitinophagaceae bacterium MMS25-I14]